MIHLFYKKKFGRNIITTEEEKIVWRSHFKTSEDSLSASVIGLIAYLPVDVIWKIFKNAFFNFSTTTVPSKLLSFAFWPHWDRTDTTNANFVEPDIFFEFDNCDVILEAKRSDNAEQQDKVQWRNEIIAYLNEYGEKDKQIYFVAVSGLADMQMKQNNLLIRDSVYSISTTGWKRILKGIQYAKHDEQKRKAKNANMDSNVERILDDIIIAFALHEFYVGNTLGTMPKGYNIKNVNFRNLKIRKYCFTRMPPNTLKNINLNYKTMLQWKPYRPQT